MLTLANGQLAVASTVMLTQGQATIAGAPQPQAWGQPVSVSLYNTGAVSQTILLKVLRSGDTTARTVARYVLAQNESAALSCLVLGPGDALYGQTTTATNTDYSVFESVPGSFQSQAYDSSGLLKLVNGTSVTSATTITSASADAFDVGPNGNTNPVFKIDASTSSQADGIKVTGAAAGSGVALQGITSGTNADILIDAAAAGTVKIGTAASTALGLQVGSSTSAAATLCIVQSTNLKALVVGRLGATTPAFQVDANTATSITGVKIKSAGTGGGVAISAIGEASNGAMTIDAQGSGTLTLQGTATGNVIVGNNVNIQVAATTGTSFGSATTQKLSFYGVTPITQPAASSAVSVTGATGASTGVSLDTTFTGGGTAAYTIGGIVVKLKALGLLAT